MSKGSILLKSSSRYQRYSGIVKVIIALIMLLILLAWIVSSRYAKDVNAGLSQNLVRLHVIANSDSQEDQALKLQVRDAIIQYMKSELSNSKDIKQTISIINADLSKIEEVSREVIKNNNSSYSVKASLGNYPFPTKTYGDITLPAGDYQALRVVIGKGEGKNWWCVLFPPLCFIDATHGTIPDNVKQELKNSLTDEEYAIITSADNDQDIPIKIKFKVVEFLQGSKIKLAGAVSKLFG
jgi:stage II sporulation protein R